MARIALLQADLRTAARITGALDDEHELVPCSSWAEIAALASSGDVDACFVDGEYPPPTKALWWIRQIRTRSPKSILVIATESKDPEHTFTLGTLGADGLVVIDGSVQEILPQVDDALRRGRARLVGEHLEDVWPEVGRRALFRATLNAGGRYTPEHLAMDLGYSSAAALRRALRSNRLPSPSRLLLWGRMLVAGARLSADEHALEKVSWALGYSAPSALARAMSRATGRTLGQVAAGIETTELLRLLIDAERRRTGGARERALFLRRAIVPFLMLFTGACASGVDRGRIDTMIESPPVDRFHIGVLAVDAESGDTLYAHNHRRKFIPASNQKVLVTAAALSLLGPEHRFTTGLWAVGERRDSVLHGDLVLVPSGDPTISRRYGTSGTAEIERLVDEVSATGIRRVSGSLFIDGSAWDSTTVTPTWEVEDLRFRYGATGSVFAIDEGEIEVVVEGAPEVGWPARVRWSPGPKDYIRPRVRTDSAGTRRSVRPTYLPESRRVVFEGVIGVNQIDTLVIAQRDPAGIAVATLSNALTRSGIEIEDGVRSLWHGGIPIGEHCFSGSIPTCAAASLVAERRSPPLIEIAGDILAPSQNWMTEQLIRSLGASHGERGDWSEGIGVMESWLIEDVGLDSADFSSRDGSGMSFYNLVTPGALVRVLQEMRTTPWANEYRLAMAEPGEEDSTLENRLPELEGRVFAKTGTISNVNSLSGYLVREDGSEIVFAILTNATGLPASRVRAAVDEIVRTLAR